MMRVNSTVILAAVILAGCQSKEAEVVGKWTGPGVTITVKDDKTFSGAASPITFTGSWKLDGDNVVFQPLTVNGQSIDDLKAKKGLISTAALDELSKPIPMKLSEDGNSMSTDKTKDKSSGATITVTKSK
jgi:hypothetical protein